MATTAVTRIWAGGYFIHHAHSPPFGWYRPDTLQTPNGRVAAAGRLGRTLDGPGNMAAGVLAGRRHDNQDRFTPKLLSKFRVRPGNSLSEPRRAARRWEAQRLVRRFSWDATRHPGRLAYNPLYRKDDYGSLYKDSRTRSA